MMQVRWCKLVYKINLKAYAGHILVTCWLPYSLQNLHIHTLTYKYTRAHKCSHTAKYFLISQQGSPYSETIACSTHDCRPSHSLLVISKAAAVWQLMCPADIPESLAYVISPPSNICRRDLKLLVSLAIDFERSTLVNCLCLTVGKTTRNALVKGAKNDCLKLRSSWNTWVEDTRDHVECPCIATYHYRALVHFMTFIKLVNDLYKNLEP